MDNPDTVPATEKVLRSFNAIRHLPPKRIAWRLVQRSRRALPARFPDATHAALRRRANALANERCHERVRAFAREKARQQSLTDTGWRSGESGTIAVSIHGHDGVLDTRAPVASASADEHYLWAMSASYLNYLLVEARDASDPVSILASLAAGYGGRNAWKVAGVHDREWHPYAASQRLVSLVCLRALHAEALTARDADAVDAAIGLHTRYVHEHREYDLHYNHLFRNLLALLVSETYREGRPSAALVDELLRVLDYQLHEDGGHTELCPMYHLLVLGDLIQLQSLPDEVLSPAHRDALGARVTRMRTAAASMSFGLGEPALFGDSWLGEAPPPPALGVTAAAAPPGEVRLDVLPDSGYAKLAAANIEAIIDIGAAGPDDNPGHAHDDYLSIELCLAGRKVVADYGVEAYAAGGARNRTRAAQSHNAPSFDGARGIETWGAFRTGRRRGAPIVRHPDEGGAWRSIEADHIPLDTPGVTLRRRLSVHPELGVAIRDTWIGVDRSRSPRSVFLMPLTLEALGSIGYRAWSPDGFEMQGGARVHPNFGVGTDATRLTVVPPGDEGWLLFVPNGVDPRTAHSDLKGDLKGDPPASPPPPS